MINKQLSYLINILAIIVCFIAGVVNLQDGRMFMAGFQFSLVVLNISAIIWLYRLKL